MGDRCIRVLQDIIQACDQPQDVRGRQFPEGLLLEELWQVANSTNCALNRNFHIDELLHRFEDALVDDWGQHCTNKVCLILNYKLEREIFKNYFQIVE